MFVFGSMRRDAVLKCDWSSDVCSSELTSEAMVDVPLVLLIEAVTVTFANVVAPLVNWTVVVSCRVSPGSYEVLSRAIERSEERRVGKEGRSRWAPYH